jgi:galactitol-specific phosphotransferase system IIB component
MKRSSVIALLIVVLAVPAMAITPRGEVHTAKRIGVLRSADVWNDRDAVGMSTAIERELTRQLHDLGYDAFDAQVTLADLERSETSDADLYVLVSGGDVAQHNFGGVGIEGRNVGTTLGVLTSRVAAEVRVYDGRSLELLDRYDLSRSKTMVAPTSIGFGDRNFFLYLAVPLVHHAQYLAVVRDVASDAAKRIAAR